MIRHSRSSAKPGCFGTKDGKSEHVEDAVGHYLAAHGLKKISIVGNVFSNSPNLIFKLSVVEVSNWASIGSNAPIRRRRRQERGVVQYQGNACRFAISAPHGETAKGVFPVVMLR